MVWLILVLPFGAAVVLAVWGEKLTPHTASRVVRGVFLVAASTALLLAQSLLQAPSDQRETLHHLYTWAEVGTLSIAIALREDVVSLSAIIAMSLGLSLAGWAFPVTADRSATRHWAFWLSLLAFALFALALVDNWVLVYAAWELADWAIFFGLAAWTQRPIHFAPSSRLIVIPRLGDAALLIGWSFYPSRLTRSM